MSASLNFVSAVNQALKQEMEKNPRIRLIGYDIGPVGGMFRVTEGLYDVFGPNRVIDTPVTESGLLGLSVGMALAGDRPVVEMQFLGFMYNGWAQFMYNVSDLHQKTGGAVNLPITIRTVFGGGVKALPFHSESTEAWFMHTPGIRVVCPSTPAQAKGLMLASLRCQDPVVFLEHARLYRLFREDVPAEDYILPLDKSRFVQHGDDLTILCWGNMVHVSLAAAQETGASIEIIDLVSLAPIDVEPILASVRKTGRCVIVYEARRTAGPGAELAALIAEHAIDSLKAPIKRATAFDVAFPENQMEEMYLPGTARVKFAIEAVLSYQS